MNIQEEKQQAVVMQTPKKLDELKNRLLDLGKRNKMINYPRSGRGTLRILNPGYEVLFNQLALEEKSLSFQRPLDRDTDLRAYSVLSLMESLSSPIEVNIGDIEAEGSPAECASALRNLRAKAKLALEEQGTNFLYLSFGFIEWREKNIASAQWLKSPLIMMPVTLTLDFLHAPYMLSRHEDEIEVNPTLDYKFNQDFGLDLPTFELKDSHSIREYMDTVEKLVDERGWKLTREVSLGLVSFLKISMYHDLENHGNRAMNNPVIRAICGDHEAVWQYRKDQTPLDEIAPDQCFQVMNADSSQQEAIRLSKQGVSFVMQGPPGIGKSQTITNIVSEALADGKRVLFVSEKAAALQVVMKRLEDVKLDDFCLSLHSHKANKKEILRQLGECLSLKRSYVTDSAMQELAQLVMNRQALNMYARELHEKNGPMEETLYGAFGRSAALHDAPEIRFELEQPMETTPMQLNLMAAHAGELERAIREVKTPLSENPWRGTVIGEADAEFRYQFERNTAGLNEKLIRLERMLREEPVSLLHGKNTMEGIGQIARILKAAAATMPFPKEWMQDEIRLPLMQEAAHNAHLQSEYLDYMEKTRTRFGEGLLTMPVGDAVRRINEVAEEIRRLPEWSGKDQGIILQSAGEIRLQAEQLKGVCVRLIEGCRKLLDQMQVSLNLLGGSIPKVICAARAVDEAWGKISPDWLNAEGRRKATELLKRLTDQRDDISGSRERIRYVWGDEALKLDAFYLRSCLLEEYERIFRRSAVGIPMRATIEAAHEKQKHVLQQITQLKSDYESARNIFGYTGNDTLTNLQDMAALLEALKDGPQLQEDWLEHHGQGQRISLLEEACERANKISQAEQKVLAEWEEEILKIDAQAMLTRFRTDYAGFFQRMRHLSSYNADVRQLKALNKSRNQKMDDDRITAVLDVVREIQRQRAWFSENHDSLKTCLGEAYDVRGLDVTSLKTQLEHADRIYDLIHAMEHSDGFAGKICALTRSDVGQQEIRTTSEKLTAQRIAEICRLMDEAEADYMLSGNQQLRDACYFIEKRLDRYQRMTDVLDVVGERVPDSDKLTAEALRVLVEQIETISQTIKNAEQQADEYDRAFNGTFRLSWREALLTEDQRAAREFLEDVGRAMERAADISSMYAGDGVPEEAVRALCITKPEHLRAAARDLLDQAYEMRKIMENGPDVLLADQCEPAQQMVGRLESVREATIRLDRISAEYEKYLISPCGKAEMYEALAAADRIVKLREELARANVGLDTDWIGTVKRIQSVHRFREETRGLPVPEEFVGWFCENDVHRACLAEASEEMQGLLKAAEPQIAYFASLFENSEELRAQEITVIADRYARCSGEFDTLEAYLHLREVIERCSEQGLGDFVRQAEGAALEEGLTDAFRREFYRQWIQQALNGRTSVRRFRRIEHEQTLRAFCEMDKKQLAIARERVRSRVIAKYPDANAPQVPGDELSILRHELSKKTRHMPIRKLFKAIPNLLLTLKPCFMMSPLSVSYFLEAESYEFDMVIFDEASQIFPQDAIGSMMRGKQVIIAGDTKQMPPSNYFISNNVSAGGDFDVDDDEYEDVIGDSILEETDGVLPSCTLLWHYRSRNEQLIAYSNQEIYGNQLVTFPGSREKEADSGVEFVHVPDGLYESKPRNCNQIEAHRCAELVFEHFSRHPERSLGVVAFSEKQQQAILEEIYQMRLNRTQYERFFDESRDEAFFVKNLETVQGDERDTILFSVGYGYTEYQKEHRRSMSMNFGPLSKAGGERRLNVAITRAKRNVKLVASILPEDLMRAESEGARLLMGYMEFAIKGSIALRSAGQAEVKDELVDRVAECIEEMGYAVRKYVGCSGYRIDIAVEHPEIEGCFAAAVELDGPSYVSARTARDRDHLRRSVLEGMGWSVYRIWSAEWHRNPEGEARRLKEFIGEACEKLAHRQKTDVHPEKKRDHQASGAEQEVYVRYEQKDAKQLPQDGLRYGFVYLEKADWQDAKVGRRQGRDRLSAVIQHIVRVEQPIHKTVLCQRTAGALGYEKITPSVRDQVDDALARMPDACVLEDQNGFVTEKTLGSVRVRIPQPDDEQRDIEYIAPEELDEAVRLVAAGTIGLSREALVDETAHALGYKRIGANIARALNAAFDRLTETNIIRMADGKVHTIGGR